MKVLTDYFLTSWRRGHIVIVPRLEHTAGSDSLARHCEHYCSGAVDAEGEEPQELECDKENTVESD